MAKFMKLAIICLIVLIALFSVEASRIQRRQESKAPAPSDAPAGGAAPPADGKTPPATPAGDGKTPADAPKDKAPESPAPTGAAGRIEASIAGTAFVAAFVGLFI